MAYDNNNDVIDSRDVIEQIEELTADLLQRHEDAGFPPDFDSWIENSRDDSTAIYAAFPDDGHDVMDLVEELYDLRALAEAEHSSALQHGETLIFESYFTD